MSDSIVAWEGPSMLDPSRKVRVVLVPQSGNGKTGGMVQLYILVKGAAPYAASLKGHDVAVCGQCPQRRYLGGGCYVRLEQGPRMTHKFSYRKRPAMAKALAMLARVAAKSTNRAVLRLGAYGDPAAVPADVMTACVNAVQGRVTGYTHQWKRAEFAHLRQYCMASVETARDALIARMGGWRYFRVTAGDSSVSAGEAICPSLSGLTCERCGICNGAVGRGKSIVIPAHGALAKRAGAIAMAA